MCDFDRLRACAKTAGISLKHLCDVLGERRTYLSECANRGADLKSGYLEALASELDVSADYLAGETDDPYDYDQDPDARIAGIPSAIFEVLHEKYGDNPSAIWHDFVAMGEDAKHESELMAQKEKLAADSDELTDEEKRFLQKFRAASQDKRQAAEYVLGLK